jgi:hypothetical protein
MAENYFAGAYVVEYAEHYSGVGEPKRQLFVTAVPGYDSQRASELQAEFENRVRTMKSALNEKPSYDIREARGDLELFERVAATRTKEVKEFEKVPVNARNSQAARELLKEYAAAFQTTGRVTVVSLLDDAEGILGKGDIRR